MRGPFWSNVALGMAIGTALPSIVFGVARVLPPSLAIAATGVSMFVIGWEACERRREPRHG